MLDEGVHERFIGETEGSGDGVDLIDADEEGYETQNDEPVCCCVEKGGAVFHYGGDG